MNVCAGVARACADSGNLHEGGVERVQECAIDCSSWVAPRLARGASDCKLAQAGLDRNSIRCRKPTRFRGQRGAKTLSGHSLA